MNAVYKAALFDLDGTLLDTLEDITDSMNKALPRLGLSGIEIGDARRFVGYGARMLAESALRHVMGAGGVSDEAVPNEMVDRLLAEYRAIYEANSAVKTKPYEGVCELLECLKEKGVLTGVLSNKPHLMTLEVLRHYFPQHQFDFAAGQRENGPRKPDPAGIYEFCATLSLKKADAIFVGDSEVDLVTAGNAGMDCIGVLWGFRGEDVLMKYNAKTLIRSPGELKRFF